MRILIISLLIALPTTALAGGWVQPEDGIYSKIWFRFLAGEGGFLADGSVEKLGSEFTDLSFGIYTEVGLTEDVTLIVAGTPFGIASGTIAGKETEAQYVGPLELGVRLPLVKGPMINAAAEVRVGFVPNTGNEIVGAGVSEDSQEPWFYQPAVSRGQFSGELQLGLALPSNMWASASLGMRNYTNDQSPSMFGFLQYGWASSFGLILDFHFNLHHPLGDVEAVNVAGTGQTDYLGLGPSISYWFTDHLGVNLSGEGVLYASSNAAAPSLVLGVELR